MSTEFGTCDYGRFDELAEEFAERYRRGERPRLQEYVDRLPAMADEIREIFPALVAVEQVEEDAREDALRKKQPAVPRLEELGDYRIVREIGRGGMGVVYEAEQLSLGRHVALKVLPRHVVGDPKALQRFQREAKAAARLHHTNIVPVFEVGQEGEVAFYTMQFIPGQGLEEVIDELRRLGGAERKPDESERDGSGGSVRPREIIERTHSSAAGPQSRKIGPVAESLLSGRLGPEGERGASAPCPTGASFTGEGADASRSPAPVPVPEGRAGGVSPLSSRAVAHPTSLRGPSLTRQAADAPRSPGSPPAADVLSSAVLPGGTAVSTVESTRGRQPYFRGVAQMGRQVAHGLAYAHSRGVVHRDIKPSNLLLDTAGVVWITDFGLAKAEDDDLTVTGDILGTIHYMAPERFRGEGDARVDIYALGLTLYELLTLRPAFATGDRLHLTERIKNEDPARPRAVDSRIPRDLETIVLKAIEKDSKQRYATADAMVEDLRRFLDDEPILARRASVAERWARWARHHPGLAVLVAGLTVVLVLTTLASLFVAGRMTRLVQDERKSRAAAQAETYRAVLSEVRSLRAGHQPGWREEALGDLALAVMPTARRNLAELRTEAAATLTTPDIRLVAQVEILSDDLRSFTFSPDGRTLVTAGCKTGLNFWDLASRAHRSYVDGLAVDESLFNKVLYLPDGQGLAVATRDRGVVFTDTQGIGTTRAPITRGSRRPTKLALSADGRRIAVAWTDGAGITVHDAASGALLDSFDGSLFALSPDGRWLARQETSDIVLQPIASDEPRFVLGRHGGASALAFSPDGTLLAVAFRDHTTVLWDVAKREQFGALRGHNEAVADVAFSPDGGWIATGAYDYTARIWETRTGQSVATLFNDGPALRVQWSPTGDYLATSPNYGNTLFLNRITGRHGVQQWLSGHRSEVRSVEAHPLRERIATSGGAELISWDLPASRPSPAVMEPNPGAVTALAYSPDGSLLATASWRGSDYREVSIRDGNTGQVRDRILRPDIVYALAFDSTGERLAWGDRVGHVVFWDLVTRRPVRQFETGSAVSSIVTLDHPRRLVTHGKDAVLLYNLESGELEKTVDLGGGGIRRLAADRARSHLVVGFGSGAIASLSLPDLTPGTRLDGAHHGNVDCLALSPDGRLLATGAADRRVVLRDAISFETLLSFPLWTGTLRDLTFGSTGRRLAIVGTNCDVDLWDLAALSDGLADLGLAWDRPAPAVVSSTGPAPAGEPLRPAVPVIRRPDATAPAAPERGR